MAIKHLDARIITNGDKYRIEGLVEKRFLFWTWTEWAAYGYCFPSMGYIPNVFDTLEEAEKGLARLQSLHEWRPV